MFQYGLYEAILEMVTRPHKALRGDFVMISRDYQYLGWNGPFNRRRLEQAHAVEGVAEVLPLSIRFLSIRNPATFGNKYVHVLGIDPGRNPFRLPDVERQLDVLKGPQSVLFDSGSDKEFGPIAERFRRDGEVATEIEGKEIRIRGLFFLGQTLAAFGHVIMSDETFARVQPAARANMINVGMICLRTGADPERTRHDLLEALPADIQILDRREFEAREKHYWLSHTPVGFITVAGMFVAMLVGGVIVYQILYTDVSQHLHEYATLRAIGMSGRFFTALVMTEAALLLVLGFVPGPLLTAGLDAMARAQAGIPARVSLPGAVLVLGMAALMCAGAGALATRRLRSADPADLF